MTEQTIEGFGLSPLQEHLWRVTSNDPHGSWIVSARVRIDGPRDDEKLREALTEISRREEILRTSFPTLPGMSVPVQSIADEGRVDLPVHEDIEIEAIERELESTPFDLAQGEVLRAAIVEWEGEATLLLVQPSIVADATSIWNLVRRIAEHLRSSTEPATERERSDEDEEEQMQFVDFAQWAHDNLEAEESAPGLEHWRRIDYTEAHLDLPLEFDRGGRGFVPERIFRRWDESDDHGVRQIAEATGASVASVLCAAWQALLARLAEREHIVTADVSSGRNFENLVDALGPFARRLPLAVSIGAHDSFYELVKRVEAARETAAEWHEVFDTERAQAPADALAYAFDNREPLDPEEAGGCSFHLLERRAVTEPFALTLELDRGLAAPELALAFDPRRFSSLDAATLLSQFDALLGHACADPRAELADLSLVTEEERSRLLELCDGGPSTPTSAAVHELIAAHAESRPDSIAVWADERQLTYAELDVRANRLANHLRSLGVGAGSYVGLYLDRSVEQIVGILGVLKAGGAYLPLPPGYPDERIAFMLEDTRARVVLTRSEVRATLPAFDGAVVELDTATELESSSATAPPVERDMARPAYVIFTSGSTGRPKGVPISHANLAHSTGARISYYEHVVESYLLLSSFAFDSSVVGIFWTLCQGGRLILPPDGFEQEIPAIAELIERHRATHMLALPSLHTLILETARASQLDSLLTVVVAGESCPPDLVRAHRDALPFTKLYNEYGPTEGTVWTSVFDCGEPFMRPSVPIGRPIPGVQTYVVDDRREPAPIGVAGELWIGGAGVADGYHDRPELTAERFVEASFAEDARLYRSGDLVRLLPDGNLEFLGRIDHQVKLRGYRIELEEIESALADHSRVREATVLAREESPGDVRLVAYVVAKADGDAPDATELRDHLGHVLPDYMVPAHFVFLADLPLLPNGKVDRKALPAPDESRSAVTAKYIEPATPLESVLAAIWADVLKRKRVGAEDDFFELGGHSILATQLFARMVEILQVTIPLRSIFDARTPRALAAMILSDDTDRERVERAAELVLSVLESPDE